MQPLILARLLFQSIKIPAYRYRLAERYGFCKKKVTPQGILLHAVSLGETLAAIPLVHALRYHYPSLSITMTTMTFTGSKCVLSELGKEVHHVYLPYDLPCAMNRFLKIVCPKLVIVMETELWPNMISALYKQKIPLIIVNARLSERSAKKYSNLGKFMRFLLEKITLVAAQNYEDGARFISLGLKYNQLTIMGNLKFDISIKPEFTTHISRLRRQWCQDRRVWIATSTHSGEEKIILQAHHDLLKKFPNLLLMLFPRHPERFNIVCNIVQKAKFNFILRSTGEDPSTTTQVIIGDTIGELRFLYGIADLAFVGGSLIKHGGHNPLEAAAHAIPILMGPHTFNFKDICMKLQKMNGLITVTDTKSIVNKVSLLLTNEDYRLWYGNCAINVLNQNRGALSRLLDIVEFYLSNQYKN